MLQDKRAQDKSMHYKIPIAGIIDEIPIDETLHEHLQQLRDMRKRKRDGHLFMDIYNAVHPGRYCNP